jgi:regulator of protease activity HflC (stomatin/prohibitin superfamily)
MENNKRLREYYEKSGTLMKLSIIGGVLSLIGMVVVIVLGISTWSKYGAWAGSDIFALIVVPFAVATLYSIAAAIYGNMAKSAYMEEEEKANLEKRKENISAFNVNEDVRFTAGRAFRNFKKYGPYVIAALGMILIAAILFSFSRMWGGRQTGVTPIPVDAMYTVVVSLVFMLFSLLFGAFFIGQSKEPVYRWLRPVGAWMIAAFVVAALAMIGGLYYYYKIPQPNQIFTRIVYISYIVLGCELAFNFISEFYRPRSLEMPRPVFESRILALFTEPGGVARNIANMLDYQFGFKVSGTWVYGFLERALFPLLIAWFVIIWLFTCIAEVGPNQVGFRMRFGEVTNKTQPLTSGIYFKLPYPFGKILTYSTDEIHQIFIGASMITEDGKQTRPDTVVWGKVHYGSEVKYLVASPTDDKSSAPVSQLTSSIPVQYRIKLDQLYDFAFRNEDAAAFLKDIGEQVAAKYFASVSIFDIMSGGRTQAARDLHKMIQNEADRLELGIEIVRVNIHDAHPPEGIAPEFQKVLSAMEEKETEIYKAKAYANRVLPESLSEQARLISEATSYAFYTKTVAQAESARFERQLGAYRILPQYFMLRSYLEMLEQNIQDVRKYILSSSLEYEVYEFNFERKSQLDLIDTDLDQLMR